MSAAQGSGEPRDNLVLHVHGGLAIREDGTYSAEAGVDPLRDVVALRSRLLWKLDFIDRWCAKQEGS